MNLGRFGSWLGAFAKRLGGTQPMSGALTPAAPPAQDVLVTAAADTFVTDAGDTIVLG